MGVQNEIPRRLNPAPPLQFPRFSTFSERELLSFGFLHRGDIAFAEAIKPHRIVVQHFLFDIVGEVLAGHEMGEVATELVAFALVREVGGPHDDVGPKQLHYVWSGTFLDFHGDEDIAAFKKIARRVLQMWRQARGEFLVVFFHSVHHKRHPAGAGFEIGDAQLGKLLKNALKHHVGDLNELSDWMLQQVGFQEAAQSIETEILANAAVNREWYIESLSFVIDLVKDG